MNKYVFRRPNGHLVTVKAKSPVAARRKLHSDRAVREKKPADLK